MKKKRFSVEQIIGILKQAEVVGVPVAEVIRKAGIAEPTFYRWKKQYVGLEVDQVRQLKQVQEENARLKRSFTPSRIFSSHLADQLPDIFGSPDDLACGTSIARTS